MDLTTLFQSMHLEPEPNNICSAPMSDSIILQDYVPLYQSLEWDLAHLAWDEYGVLPFAEGNVPFYITSSGLLSYKSAGLLFDACALIPKNEEIKILELGAGSGLFARLLLDSFKHLCQEHDKDYYQRLKFFISDGSQKTIDDWYERKLFEDHQEQVSLQVLNIFSESAFDKKEYEGLAAIYCSYILDILPFSVIRYNNDAFEELYYRTTIRSGEQALSQYTESSLDEIKDCAESNEQNKRKKLLDISELLDTEMDYQALSDHQKIPEPVKQWIIKENIQSPMAVNYGALYCIQKCANLLIDTGYILVNDYGPVSGEELSQKISHKRFGQTLAMDINFPVLDYCVAHMGLQSIKSSIDDSQSLHSRLISKNNIDYNEQYEKYFGSDFFNKINGPLSTARDCVNKGNMREAQYLYLQALEANSDDWFMIGEIAEFFLIHQSDAQTALPYVQRAISMNPWYSTWLWDILGDCLFSLKRFEDGGKAYQQAIKINPKDSASNLRMASYYEYKGRYEDALKAVAVGLVNDKKGSQRSALLEQQARILARIG